MTATSDDATTVVPSNHIKASIDDIEVVVPKGTLVIRAAEEIGIDIPRFCDHPLLEPVAACRMCLIEIKGMPKPQPACAIPLTDGMEVHTQLTSTVAEVAQKGVMEFLLINHPLDCPICDKGGECPLQNQAMSDGRGESRFDGVKRTFPKPINISTQILLDRERCISCARCTRFAEQIAGDDFIELVERGAKQQIGIAKDNPFDSYFSGNTVQICPVGALTSAGYRFRSRPFDLVSTPTVCEHCASGCALRTDSRRDTVMRRLAGDDPQVNEEWNCDKGRFAFTYLTHDRIENPLIRENGELRTASWPEAIALVADKLAAAHGKAGFLTGGRLTNEDAYLYSKFARGVMRSDDIDFRFRASSAEEHDFLASYIAGSGLGVTYEDLEKAPAVLLVSLEPEEESPIIFLRLRKAARAGTTKVTALAPWLTPGYEKMNTSLIHTIPGDEAQVLAQIAESAQAAELSQPGALILVGERLADCPGGLTAAVRLATATGASLAWVPRRAGERGALDAGALAGVLPGGRPIADAGARAEVASLWGLAADALPSRPGMTAAAIFDSIHEDAQARDNGAEDFQERISALIVGGVEIRDWSDPAYARAAFAEVPFLLQLSPHFNEVTEHADVVLPVKVDTERDGSYTDWEGRVRHFNRTFRSASGYTDGQVLALIAQHLGKDIANVNRPEAAAELQALGDWNEERPAFRPRESAPEVVGEGQAILSTWRHLLDEGFMQAGEEYLAGTSRQAVARISTATAQSVGVADGDLLTVSSDAGHITLPVVITNMPDFTVWLPGNSAGSDVHSALAASSGAVVNIRSGLAGGA